MKRIRLNAKGLAITLTVLAGAACSGGGGGGSSTPKASSLAGSWVGTEKQQPSGDWVELRLVVNNDSKITSIKVDGVNTGETGSLSPSGKPNIYDVLLSDGTEGGFFLDAQGTHAVFVDEEANFGVLQKGATGMAVPDLGKLAGDNYEGTSCMLDGSFEISALDRNASGSVALDGAFQGAHFGLTFANTQDSFQDGNGDPLDGRLQIYSGASDVFAGLWEASDGSIGLCYVVPSQDHRMYGVWGIEWDHQGGHLGTDWSDWTFSAVSRN